MKQSAFESRHREFWAALESRLHWLDRPRGQVPKAALGVAELPGAYRRLALHLAVARERHYSASLVARLEGLALGAHRHLYAAPRGRGQRVLDFLAAGFPRRVRREGPLLALSLLLFAGPLVGLGLAVYLSPPLIYALLDPETVMEFEAMYRLTEPRDRDPAQDLLMFGYYVYNNIGIGFRTFAAGLLFGAGSAGVLLFNGLHIGAVAGYLSARGLGDAFWTFVIAHGAFELTAIVLAGVAGLRLGLALLAPGRYSRRQALGRAARGGAAIIVGAALMLLVAAVIEAFWSSNRALTDEVKYTVGAGCWLLVIGYLALGGRRGH